MAARLPEPSIRVRGSIGEPCKKMSERFCGQRSERWLTSAIVTDDPGEDIAIAIAAHPIVDYQFA